MIDSEKVQLYRMKNIKWWDKELLKKIARIGLPLVLLSLLFSLTEVIDNISLGIWAPKNAIAIAGYAGRLYWISFLIVLMPASMFGFLVAQYYGAKDYQKEKRVISIVTLLSFSTSIISLIIIYIFGKDILGIFIKEDAKYSSYRENAYDYVKVFSYLMLLEAIIQALQLGVVAEGKTKVAAMISFLVVPLNLIFNFIFMKALDWGTIGCAYSTFCSWSIVFVLLITWVVINTKRGSIHFGFNPLKIFKIDRKILIIGLKRFGNGLAAIFTQLSIVAIFTIFSKNYSNGMIVTAITMPFFNLIMFVGNGVVGTKSHLVGTKLGAGHFQKAYEIDAKINFYAFVFAIINAIFIASLAYPIPLIYAKESAENKLLATYFLLATAFSYPMMIISSSFVGSLVIGGKGNQAFLVNSVQPFIIEVGALLLLALTTNISLLLIYITYQLLKTLRVVSSYLLWRRKTWITNETKIVKTLTS